MSGLQLVQSLIALHARFAHIVDSCFAKSMIFQKALKTVRLPRLLSFISPYSFQTRQAFTEFINADTRVCQLLAQFAHDLLQKGAKFRVEDLDDTLDQVSH